MISLGSIILVVIAIAFSWSMGAHYTGACMGMPYATGSIKLRPALVLMAVMTLIGASFFSHHVLIHVGRGIIVGQLSEIGAIATIGVAFALGVLTWGRPLLERVAFDIVRMDRVMATAAQMVQAAVILVAVGFGYFTSMNQALIGAMAGTGFARGRQTIRTQTILGILRGWVIGPAAGFALTYVAAWALAVAAGKPAG